MNSKDVIIKDPSDTISNSEVKIIKHMIATSMPHCRTSEADYAISKISENHWKVKIETKLVRANGTFDRSARTVWFQTL
jgi:hypothetical protein